MAMRRSCKGTPDAGSVNATSGLIQIAIANNKVGNPGAGAVLGLLSGRNFAGNGNVTVTKSSAIDSTADGSYTLVGNAACAAGVSLIEVVSRKTHGTADFDVPLPLGSNRGLNVASDNLTQAHTKLSLGSQTR